MPDGYKFAPLNVRAVYQNDGSAKSSFLAEVAKMTSDAGKLFKDFSVEARTQLDAALSVKRNGSGSLDLGVNELRAAAAAQNARAIAAREVAAATALAAKEEGDYSQKARLAVAATQALAIEEERAAAQARAHAQAAEQVQERLNRQASATDLVVAATKRGTTETGNIINGIRAQRVAFTQLGQQLQDVVVQTQMGTNATTIFVQQVPQMAFALSGLTESTNKFYRGIGTVGTFLAGPWGAAVFAATAVLAPFVLKLLESGSALEDQAKQLGSASKAADSYGNAQSVLSQIIDLTTGKLKTQNNVLIQTIKLQAQANILAAQAAQKAGLGKVKEIGDRSTVENIGAAFSGIGSVLGGGQRGQQGQKLNAALAPLRQDLEAYRKSAEQYQRVLNDPKAGTAAIEAASARFNKSLDSTLEKLSVSAKKGNRDVIATKQQVLELGAALNDQRANQLVVDAASGKPIDPLLKPYKAPGKPTKPKQDKSGEAAERAANRLREFGEDAGKKIANIRDSFADIPPEVERVNKATRELDDIITDLQTRKPVNFEQSIAEAEALKKQLPDLGIQRAMRQITEDARRQVQYQMLILQGRSGEAQALQIIAQKEEQFRKLTQAQKDEIIATGIAMQRVNEQIQRAQEIQSVFLDSTRSIRAEVEGILGGYGSLSSLASVLRRQFQNIQGKVLSEKLFGNIFRDMDEYVRNKTGISQSVDLMQSETERAGNSAKDFATAIEQATSRILGGGSGYGGIVAGTSAVTAWGTMKVPDSIRLPGYDVDPNGPLTVAGVGKPNVQKKVTDLTPEEFFRKMGHDVGKRWADFLEPLLGKKLAGNLGGVIGGIFEGRASTGTGFGAILGGLKEIKGLPKSLSEDLSKAFKGAQTGAAVAGISSALGLKMSNTGAQIGGAIGKFIPIPGGEIIGSIAGGLLGNLFGKKVTSGYAQVRNGSVVGTYGRTKDLQNDASEAAGGLVDTIASLAKTLNVRLGAYDFDYGKKDSKFVVNTGARGVFNFDNEQQAMEFAVREAVADGAFIGIRDAQKRLIMANGDLQAQVEKAVKFGDVFKQLKAFKDPTGAALDDLNSQFSDLISVFKEAGASAQELGDLEQLYGIKRKDALKQATDSMLGPIKSLLDSINIGSDFYSLRDRQAAAQAAYNPLAERVKAGDMTAYSEYSDAAQTLIEVNRALYGSTSPFYDFLDSVKALSNGTLATEQAKIDAATASDSPFKDLATQQQATTSAIDNQTQRLIEALGGRLDTLNDNLINAIRSSVASGSASNVTSLLSAGGAW